MRWTSHLTFSLSGRGASAGKDQSPYFRAPLEALVSGDNKQDTI